jgi:hypothetical protein
MWLHDYRAKHREACLQLLWSQWVALGVAGYVVTRPQSPVDIEALLLATTTFGRWDARLFDAVLDWQYKNDHYVNIQRLRNIASKENVGDLTVLCAMARLLYRQGERTKWRSLARQEHPKAMTTQALFRALDKADSVPAVVDPDFESMGLLRPPVQFRDSNLAPFEASPATLALQLRGLFGISARSELVLYMLCKGQATLDEAARKLYFSKRSLYDTYSELQSTPWVLKSGNSARKSIRLTRKLSDALLDGHAPPNWINWAARWAALEQISNLLDDMVVKPGFDPEAESLLLASVIGQRWAAIRETLKEGDVFELPGDSHTPRAEAILDSFQEDLDALHNLLIRSR